MFHIPSTLKLAQYTKPGTFLWQTEVPMLMNVHCPFKNKNKKQTNNAEREPDGLFQLRLWFSGVVDVLWRLMEPVVSRAILYAGLDWDKNLRAEHISSLNKPIQRARSAWLRREGGQYMQLWRGGCCKNSFSSWRKPHTLCQTSLLSRGAGSARDDCWQPNTRSFLPLDVQLCLLNL